MKYNLEKTLLTMLLIILSFAWAAPSKAVIFPRPLEGISEVRIVIDKLPPDALTVNITEKALKDTILTLLNRNL
ncbi:MAG: hypothetical protein V3U04_08500, partial [Candidatus Aerophobetes bacterium]